MEILFIILVFCLSIAIYFLPTIICYTNDHERIIPIFLINFVFGWSVLGWFIALIWSLCKPLSSIQVTDTANVTSVCKYCKETIRHDAIKCKHCGSSLEVN